MEEQRQQFDEQLLRQKEEMASSTTHHRSHDSNSTLQQQLRHSQDQVRMLKATMEQFLRMGIFSEDVSVYKDIAARYSTTLKARYVLHTTHGPFIHSCIIHSPIECLAEQHEQQQKQQRIETPPSPPMTAPHHHHHHHHNHHHSHQHEQQQHDNIQSPADLDIVLRKLLREKDIVGCHDDDGMTDPPPITNNVHPLSAPR